jgi:type II secretory pathway predicted ATPase ExeA
MYEKQFQFRSRPFCTIPAAEHYFPASAIDAALDTLKICIERASGPAIVIGQSGWGKSLLLAVLQNEFKSQFRAVNVMACTRMSRRHDLLQNILFELGQPYRDMSEGELRLALIDYLKPSAQCLNGVLLLVDDGQSLPTRLLDELRMITNFVRDGQPRVRLVIAGTQQLEEKLAHPQLESLNQRIAARCYLQSLRRDEIEAYVRHHVVRAGRGEQNLFQPSAMAALIQLCDGNPRTINQVCDHALILAASCGHSIVNGEIIAEAYSDIQHLPASMWLPQLEASTAEPASTNASWSVLEFGRIDDATPAMPQSEPASEPESTPASYDEITTTAAISNSVDEFSRMVDSLSSHFAAVEHGIDPIDLIPESAPSDAEYISLDPFAEPFAEEFSVHDNYAQIAAKQNRVAARIEDHEMAAVQGQLQAIQSELSNALTTTPVIANMQNSSATESVPAASQPSFEFVGVQPKDVNVPAKTAAPDVEHTEDTQPEVVELPLTQFNPFHDASLDSTRASSPSADSQIQDDRDMLIVRTQKPNSKTAARVAPLDLGNKTVSRGQAIRLDYSKLFQRLRDEESEK